MAEEIISAKYAVEHTKAVINRLTKVSDEDINSAIKRINQMVMASADFKTLSYWKDLFDNKMNDITLEAAIDILTEKLTKAGYTVKTEDKDIQQNPYFVISWRE